MISLYYNEGLRVGVVMRDGMPAVVITDDFVGDHETFVSDATSLAQLRGKMSFQRTFLEVFLRCPDDQLGWRRL